MFFFQCRIESRDFKSFRFNIFNETYVWRVILQGFGWREIRFVERVKGILHGLRVIDYADDVLVGASSTAEHDCNLRLVLRRFEKFGLRLNKDKVILDVSEDDFLGFRVEAGGFSLKHYMEEKTTTTPTLQTARENDQSPQFLSNTCPQPEQEDRSASLGQNREH